MAKKKVTTTVTTTVTETVVDNEKNKTHIICILDRSGSMESVAKDAIGGFNAFLKDQKATDGEATMSVTLFDNEYTPLYDGKSIPLAKVDELTDKTFVPRGSTALRDAIGKTIGRTKEEFAKMSDSEKPNKVLVLIVTDGAENASHEYNAETIKNLIATQKKNDWQFIFLCSTEDAMNRAGDMGISFGNTFQFTNTSAGNQVLYSNVSNATKFFRSAKIGTAEYSASVDSLMDLGQAGIDDVSKLKTTSGSATTSETKEEK
ncbi:MAG: VWA domain-containing protein [Richelia sp. RM2_1_2]|nr:VWA domain-containing protein [Richelia sp. RM2_1_2]